MISSQLPAQQIKLEIMFTLNQIKAAHSKVKSGADFPAYIEDLKKLGITCYETFVDDGHTEYYSANSHQVSSPAQYSSRTVASTANRTQFQTDLKAHQAGETDYQTFCKDCAKSGIEKWVVILDEMTCTYFDKEEDEVLVEVIPG